MSGLRASAHRRSRRHAAGRLAALLLTLAGLFSMHGLADHGSSGHGLLPGMTGTSSTTAPDAAPVVGHHASHEDAGHATGAAGDADRPGHGEGHGGTDLLELCLAVLGALLALGAGARLRWPSRLAPPVRPALAPTAVRVRARDPAPPDLVRLCIHRC
ncbi:hypothetical protein GCM10023340_17360 [Nocardioides marinquilinus]|uniref:DUF2946 domain-containing protein n=1 Tax=Nocardioides marinquilinus TaxID=1210400 RepID=A0ABP9PK42_9ACTN